MQCLRQQLAKYDLHVLRFLFSLFFSAGWTRVQCSGRKQSSNSPPPHHQKKKNTKHKSTLIFIFLSHAQAEWVYISQNVKLFLLKPLDWKRKKRKKGAKHADVLFCSYISAWHSGVTAPCCSKMCLANVSTHVHRIVFTVSFARGLNVSVSPSPCATWSGTRGPTFPH